MPSTVNLQATMNWCGAFINYQPLLIGGQEPALTNGNTILGTMLGPPFCWRFNRSTISFNASQTGGVWNQDYQLNIPDFGFVEKSWVKHPTQNDIKEIPNKVSLSRSAEPGRPAHISAQYDDGSGNITFRTLPVPNVAYVISLDYQKKAPLLSSVSQTWAPVPDEFAYIFNWGFLGLASIMLGDGRFPIFMQKFTAHLLGAQDGLDEMQKNLFLSNWLDLQKAAERAQLKTNQGIAARQQ